MRHPSGSTSASTSTWLCLLVLCTGLVHTTALTLTPDQFLTGQSFYYHEYSPHSFSSLFSSESSPVLYVKFNTTTSMWRSTHDMYVRIMDFGLFEPAQGDTLVYEVYWNTNLNAAIALDIRTNDKLGTKSFANVEPAPQDQNHLSARVGTDLRPHATTQWYRRQIPIPATMMNRGGISFWVGCARRESGIYSAQFRSISIVNSATGRHTIVYGDSLWQAISMLTCIIVMVIVALLVFLIVCRQRRMQSAIKKWQTTESSDSTSSSSPSSARRDPQSYSLLVDADDNASPSNARTVTTSPSQSPPQSPSSPSSASRVRDRRTFQAEFMDQRFCCIRPPKCLSPDSCWVPLVSWSMLLPTLSVLLFASLGLTITASAIDSWVILDQNVSITFGVVEIRSAWPSYPVGSFNYSCNGLTCTIVRFAGLVVLILQIISAFLLSCVLLSMLRSRYRRWRLTEQQRHLPATYLQYQHHVSNVTCMITVAFMCMGVTVCVAAVGMFWPMVQDVTNVLHSIDHGINQFPTLMWGNYILLGVSWVIQCVPMGMLLFVTPMMHIYHRWVLTVTIKQREQWHAQQIQRQYLQRRFAFWLHSPTNNVNTHHPEQQMIQIQPRTSSHLPGIAIDAIATPIVIPQPGSESVVSVAEAHTAAHTIRRLSGSQGPGTATPTNTAMTRTMRSISTSSTVAYMTQLYQKAPYQQVSIPGTTPLTAAIQAPRVTSVSIAASTPVERQLAMQAAPSLRTSPSPYPLPLSPSSLIADMPTLTLARVRSISQPFSLRTGLPPPPVSSRRASAIFELSQPLLSTSTLSQQHVADSTRYSRTDHRQREEGDEADD